MLRFRCVGGYAEVRGTALEQELGDSSGAAELPVFCSLGHLLPKMGSHQITLRMVGLGTIDFCSNRLSFSADKQKTK